MKIDSHYYALLAFARACGFKQESAYKLAYASQFVDDAKINYITVRDENTLESIGVNVKYFEKSNSGKRVFHDMATCHSYEKIKTFTYESMTRNTCAFHFVPGGEGESFVHKMRCVEDSKIIQGILKEALEYNDVIRLGIVMHAYADTFSHQGFSGLLSRINDIDDLKPKFKGASLTESMILRVKHYSNRAKYKLMKYADRFVPAYGHAQAVDFPDLPYLTWRYTYDASDYSLEDWSEKEVDNTFRFRFAFEKISAHLRGYLEKNPEHKDESFIYPVTEELYKKLLSNEREGVRIKNWRSFMTANGMFPENHPALTYDKYQWLKNAFSDFSKRKFDQRKVENVELAPDFENKEWYSFYNSVHWYKERFFDYCEQYGVKISM